MSITVAPVRWSSTPGETRAELWKDEQAQPLKGR